MSGKRAKQTRRTERELEMKLRTTLNAADTQSMADRAAVMIAAGNLHDRSPANKELERAKMFLEAFRRPFVYDEVVANLEATVVRERELGDTYSHNAALLDFIKIRKLIGEEKYEEVATQLNALRSVWETMADRATGGYLCRACGYRTAGGKCAQEIVNPLIANSIDDLPLSTCLKFTPFALLTECQLTLVHAKLNLGEGAVLWAASIMHQSFTKTIRYGDAEILPGTVKLLAKFYAAKED